MRLALIYNPLSGTRHSRRTHVINSVQSIFERAGHKVSLFPTQYAGHAFALTREAAPSHDAIIAAGGDGTAHEIIQPLIEMRSHCALGVVPLGTGNVLATDIGLPRDPVAAAHLLLDYAPQRLSAGRIEYVDGSGQPASRYFTVAAGVGAHARLIYAASAAAKKRGGMITYYYTGFYSLFTHRFAPMHASITAPDGTVSERTILEAVAMRVSSFGGLLGRWRPGGALLRNDLRLIFLTRANRAALVRYSLAAFAGRTRESADVQFASATRITCEPFPEPPGGAMPHRPIALAPIYAQADGEVLGAAPVTLSVVPDAFRLLVPRASLLDATS